MQGTPKMELVMGAVRRFADSEQTAADYNACWDRIAYLIEMSDEKIADRTRAAFTLDGMRDAH
jgi:hypothetical protein